MIPEFADGAGRRRSACFRATATPVARSSPRRNRNQARGVPTRARRSHAFRPFLQYPRRDCAAHCQQPHVGIEGCGGEQPVAGRGVDDEQDHAGVGRQWQQCGGFSVDGSGAHRGRRPRRPASPPPAARRSGTYPIPGRMTSTPTPSRNRLSGMERRSLWLSWPLCRALHNGHLRSYPIAPRSRRCLALTTNRGDLEDDLKSPRNHQLKVVFCALR